MGLLGSIGSALGDLSSSVGNLSSSIIGGFTGATQQGKAAEKAGQLQAEYAGKGIDEQRRQFDALTQLLSPYVSSGSSAMTQQRNILGLNGASDQQAAISAIANSPLLQQLMQQGETGILQNASATGGLRGGNLQGALAQFRPSMLQQAIDQQYSRLGGLTAMGQASAAGQGAQGMSLASNVGNLLSNQGAALAGGIIGQGNTARQAFQDQMQMAKAFIDAKSAKVF